MTFPSTHRTPLRRSKSKQKSKGEEQVQEKFGQQTCLSQRGGETYRDVDGFIGVLSIECGEILGREQSTSFL